MKEYGHFHGATNLNKIIDNIENKTPYTCDWPHVSTFPEHYHPRRKMMYKPWECDSNTFFTLRSRGVPVLTAYFLCETSNNVRIHRYISTFLSSQNTNAAINTLKIM